MFCLRGSLRLILSLLNKRSNFVPLQLSLPLSPHRSSPPSALSQLLDLWRHYVGHTEDLMHHRFPHEVQMACLQDVCRVFDNDNNDHGAGQQPPSGGGHHTDSSAGLSNHRCWTDFCFFSPLMKPSWMYSPDFTQLHTCALAVWSKLTAKILRICFMHLNVKVIVSPQILKKPASV